MDILLLAPQPFYQSRGTPIAVRVLAEELGRAGHRVDLLTYHEGTDVAMEGVSLHRIPKVPGMSNVGPGLSLKKVVCDAILAARARSMLRAKRYQIMHAVEEAAFIAQLLGRAYGVPFVYDMDSSMSEQITDKYPLLKSAAGLMGWLEHRMMRASAGIVAVCRSLEERARAAAPSVPVVRLEDISLLQESPPAVEQIREVHGIDGSIVLYVGNLERYQGVDLLLESFAQLPPQQRAKTNLVIIGGNASDIAKYRQLARQLEVDQRVFFLGPRPVEHLGGYLIQADILVSPRIQGTNTPMKIYSYLDSGRPVLATDLPTHTQVLDPAIAMLAQPEARHFARALTTLLTNEHLRQDLALAAKQKLEAEHSRQAFRERLRRFYGDLESRLRIGC